MSYVNKTVSINGTEKDFIKAFANELTSADNRITCETDIDAEFANEDSSYIPTIIFNINNCYKIKLIRGSAIAGKTYLYNIKAAINNIDKSSVSLNFLGTIKQAISYFINFALMIFVCTNKLRFACYCINTIAISYNVKILFVI